MRSRPAAYVLPALRGSGAHGAERIRRTLDECAAYTMLDVELSTGRHVKELTDSCPWDLEPNEGPDKHDEEVESERKVSGASLASPCTTQSHHVASGSSHFAAF
jgi:hypothetical protein